MPLLGMPPVNPDADFAQLCAHVESTLPEESPLVYGLHPNAQHALLTAQVKSVVSCVEKPSQSSYRCSSSAFVLYAFCMFLGRL